MMMVMMMMTKISLKNKSDSTAANAHPTKEAVDPLLTPPPKTVPLRPEAATVKPPLRHVPSERHFFRTATEVSLSSGKGKLILYLFQISPLYGTQSLT